MKIANIIKIIGIVAVLGLPGSLFAQYYDDPGLGQKPVAAHPQDFKPLGIRAGAFMLHPGVQLAAEFTDNVFYTYRDTRSSTIYHIRPYITAQSTWSRHSLNVRLAADLAWYHKYDSQNYQDYFLTINGQVDVQNRSYFSYDALAMRLHEGRNNRSSEQGYEPTVYYLYGGGIGYDHTFNRLALGAALGWQRFDYDNAYSLIEGVIDNQDRDRDIFDWMVRAGYQFRSEMQAFVSYTGYDTNYDLQYDRNGYDRSGNGYGINAGLNFTITAKLNGSLAASYVSRSYDDVILPDTSGWGLHAGLSWTPTYLTTVSVAADTSVEETTIKWASGYVRTLYSVRVDHELLRNVQLNGFASYSDNDFQVIPGAPEDSRSWDHIYRFGAGVSWFINRNLFLNASYDYAKLKTNVPDDGYTTNNVWLVLGLER